MRRGWESWDCLESRSEFINSYKYLNRGGKEDRPRLFSVMPSDRIRGNEHTLKYGTFPLNIRKHYFTVKVTKHWYRLPRKVFQGASILRDIQKLFGHGAGQPAWEEGLYQLTSRGSFKPQWYCGSVWFYLQTNSSLKELKALPLLYWNSKHGTETFNLRSYIVCSLHTWSSLCKGNL